MKSATRPLALLLAAAVVVAVYIVGVQPRLRAAADLAAHEKKSDRPTVNVVVATRATTAAEVILPASLQAFQEASIYARTGGYLSKWLVDLGDKVTAGQTLAVIEGPELEQELNQASAALTQTRANAELARTTAARWRDLSDRNAVSKQEADEKSAASTARAADVQAAEANAARLTQLKSLQTITAPFDGVIAARGAEIGTLISTDATRRELFRLTSLNPLRVYATVPQTYMRSMQPGLEADVLVNEFPGRAFPAKVVHVAGALDPATRTLQTELQLPNADGELLPGMFVQVRFHLKPGAPALLLPSNAIIIRADGPQVAIVGTDNTVHFQKIKIARDFGTQIEVVSGLADAARVVANPNDTITEGLVVEPLLPAPAKK